MFHVLYGGIEIVDHTNRHNGVLIFCGPIFFFSAAKWMIVERGELRVGGIVSADFHFLLLEFGCGLAAGTPG